MALSRILNRVSARPWLLLAVLLAVYCLVCCCLTSCATGRAVASSPADNAEASRVAQAIADSRAGIEAAKIQIGPAIDPRADQMLDGASEYALAAAGKTPVPAPAMAPAAIVADPDAYHKAAVSTRQHADGTWLWVTIGSVGAALLPVAAMLLKDFGGPIGAIAGNIALPLANAGWHAFAPKVAKDADAKAQDVTAQARVLIATVDNIDPVILGGLPQPIRAAIANLRAAHQG